MINEHLKEQVMEDIVLLWLIGVKVVLVHGGGPEISDLMAKLGKKMPMASGVWLAAVSRPSNWAPERHWPIEQTMLCALC